MTAKEKTAELLSKLPDSSSLEDIQYHLYVIEKVQNGFAKIDDGKFLTNEEAGKNLSKWLTK